MHRCSTISALKARVSELEKLVPRLKELEKKVASSGISSPTPLPLISAPMQSPLLSSRPHLPSLSPTPTPTPTPSALVPSSDPLAPDAGVNSHGDSPDVKTLLASIQNSPKTDVSGTVKKLALSIFSKEELCDCSLSGKRSVFTKAVVRPALNPKLVNSIEQAASQHLSLTLDRKTFVEKFQNVQKHIRSLRAKTNISNENF